MNGGTFSWPGTDRANSQREQRKHGNKKPMIRSNWAKKIKKIKKITQKKEEKNPSSCSQNMYDGAEAIFKRVKAGSCVYTSLMTDSC